MNKTHRVVWSDAHQAFVVTHENAKSRGKPSSARTLVAAAVALGLGSLIAPYAMAAGSCANSGATTIGGARTLTCTLASGGSLNVTSQGSITASGPGVLLGAAAATPTTGVVNDTLLIRNAGRISGANDSTAVLISATSASGSVLNAATGVLGDAAGTGSGIRLQNATLDGYVRNLGSITGQGDGVGLLGSVLAGNLDNRNAITSRVGFNVQNSTIKGSLLDSGNISSGNVAILVSDSQIGGNLSVQGSAAGGNNAVALSNDSIGGSVSNSGNLWAQRTALLLSNTQVAGNLSNSGSVEGSTGVKIDGGGFNALRNSGTVLGRDFATQITQAHLGGGITNTGTLAIIAPNYEGAPNPNIGHGLDVQLSSLGKDIDNAGTISGGSLGGAGVHIGGSSLGRNFVNGGSISGHDQGVHIYSSSLKGSLTNDGVIAATFGGAGTGLLFTTDTLRGDIINRGLISGASSGLQLDRTSLAGSVVNSGTIDGINVSKAGLLLTQSTLGHDILNTGTIAGVHAAILLDQGSVVHGNVVNDGAVIGEGYDGIVLTNAKIDGNLVNNASVRATSNGYRLSDATVGGSLVNTGKITSNGPGIFISDHSALAGIANSSAVISTYGLAVEIHDSVIGKGGIANSGTMSGGRGGVQLTDSTVNGSIVNTGSMVATDNYVLSSVNGLGLKNTTLNGDIVNGGALSGFNALSLEQSTVIGSIDNAGQASGSFGTGIKLTDSVLDGNLVNRLGSTVGGRSGVALSNSTITGQLNTAATVQTKFGALSVNNSVVTGGVTNSGTLLSYESANSIANSSIGSFVNSGTVRGQGPSLGLSNDRVSGDIGNSGVMYGLELDATTVNGVLRNSGTITANFHGAVDVEKNSYLNGIVNTGSLINSGLYGVTGPALGVFDSVIGTQGIQNSGTLEGAGGLLLSTATVVGNIDNRGIVSASGSPGIALANSVVGGAILNAGRLNNGGISLGGQSLVGRGITNSGSVTAVGSAAISIANSTIRSGGIVNSGSLLGSNGAIAIDNSSVSGAIVNAGTARYTSNFDTVGNDGLRLTNSRLSGNLINSGSLDGNVGLHVQQSTIVGSIDNSGAIGGFTSGVLLTDSSVFGNLVNRTGSTITGRNGLVLNNSSITGQLINAANIGSDYGALSLTDSEISGGLTNTGRIDTYMNAGLIRRSVLGSFDNSGFIRGIGDGYAIVDSRITGTLSNSGTITGLQLDNTTVGGTLQNSGSIAANYKGAVWIANHASVNAIVNSGSVLNTGTGDTSVAGPAIGIYDSSIGSGGIDNRAGSLTGLDGGVLVSNSVVEGNILNAALMAATSTSNDGANGLALTDATLLRGSIVNTGTISGVNAIDVRGSDVRGSIINSGTLAATTSAVLLDNARLSGDLLNNGNISGQSAIRLIDASVAGTLINNGTLSGQLQGLDVRDSTVIGGVNNSGALVASNGSNRLVNDTMSNIINSGVISGAFSGLEIEGGAITSDIRNSGSIGARVIGLSLSGVDVLGVTSNSGTLSGRSSALSIDNSRLALGIDNSGLISSQDTNVIRNSTLGGFDNSGTIIGGNTGLDIIGSTLNGPLVNSGAILGGRYALLSENGSVTQLVIAGNDTAVFAGEVSAPEAHVSVARGAAYTLRAGNLFSVADFTNYGTLSIASDATARIAGDYFQDANATLSTQAVNATSFGKLQVTGSATLPDQARFNVDVVDSGQSFSGARLNNVLSAGTLNSNGNYAVTSNSALFDFNGVKNGNSVDLVAAPKSATAVTQALQGSGNRSAARALDSGLASNGSLTPFFVGATNSAQVASAVSQTLPSNAVAATQVSQSTLSTITDVVQSRIDANTGLASGDGFYGDKNLWMKPFGSWINQSERGDSPGYDASVYGMAFGVDAPVNELLRLGVSFSYANADTNSKADVSSQSAKVDLYQLMGYGSYTVAPNTELSFHAGVGQNRNDGERNLNLNGIGGKASANYDSRSVTAGVALAKAFDLSPTTRFIPSVRADYTWLQDDSYSEKGSAALQPLLLKVDKHQTDQLIVGLDGKLSHEIVPGTQVTGNLGVGYDVIHDDSMLTSTYAGAPGQSFNTVGQSSSPWLARGGVGLSTKIASNGTELSVNYDGEVRTDFTNQTVSLKVKMPF